MDNYKSLKPGLYLQVGDSIKTLADGREYYGSFANAMRSGSNANPSLERIAGEVAWVWIALHKRRQKLLEVPYNWQLGGEDVDEPPFGMKDKELFQQIDTSLQLYSSAYLLKQRGMFSRQAGGVRWLDPNTIEPDYDSATPEDGIQRYKRYLGEGARWEWLDAKDVIRFMIPGMRELKPDVSAVRATSLAAQILMGMSHTLDTFMDNNALPVMLVKVPMSTSEPEIGRVQTAMRRLFNQRKGTNDIRVQGVRSDIEVETLSFKPSELEMDTISEWERDAILAAHDVPKVIAISGATTFENAASGIRDMILTMGSRLEYIASVFDDDPDLSDYHLDVRANDHPAMKEDEKQRADAFSTYVAGGFTTEAAAYLVGISVEDFPADIEVFDEKEEPEPAPAFGQPMVPAAPMPMDNQAREDEEAQLKRWARKRTNPNPSHFKASYLTDEEKEFIVYDVLGERQTADIFDQFADAVKQLAPVATGEDGEQSADD